MNPDTICWDSSVMISHIGGDKSEDPLRERKIKSIVTAIDKGDHRLIISTILYVEVLASGMPPEAARLFEDFVKRREIKNIAVGINVAGKAQSLRQRIRSLKTPDAIHIATAIVGKAGVFHTFDEQLLALSKQERVDGLAITPCEIPAMQLSLI